MAGIGVLTTGSRVRLGLASDEWLVACVRRGDTAAFEALYDRHAAELLRFCVYMLTSRQDAEDAVQATFASAYRALRADGRKVALRPWLFTIARNECLTTLRRRRPVVELNGEIAPGADPLEQIELRDEVRRVFQGLRDLPESQRAALVLAELHGLSHTEVGSVMGVRADQVKAFVYQARSKLVSERAARDADCREIREELAGARGSALLRGRLRRHVRSCPDCRTYADGMARQRRQLGALMPIVPPLALKYRALEEALGIGASDPVTVAGGATMGATAAGTAAELAGGGFNALVCKVAVGVACLGASAGVGVSVLGSQGAGSGWPGGTSATAGTTATAPLVASVAPADSLPWTNTAPAFDRAPAVQEAGGGESGEQNASAPGLPVVQNGVQIHNDGTAGGGSGPTSTTRRETGHRGARTPSTGGSEHHAPSGETRLKHESHHQLHEQKSTAREERRREGHTREALSEEEKRLKHEKKAGEKPEKEPEGHSRGPRTEEELQLKKEKRERKKAERQKLLEEQEAREREAAGGG